MRAIKLNSNQQEAVDHIYGPLLVLAGPGTGKTQLLSARIANILQKTDANAQNILCLTFTESAAQNMRERLSSIIGSDAYDVHINTYHGFGSDIIRSYPTYFEEMDLETGKDSRLEQPIDDLRRLQIVESIINKLPYDNPLIGAKHYIKQLVSTISELKRGTYTPDTLNALAVSNLKQLNDLIPKIADSLSGLKRMPGKADQSLEFFTPVLEVLEGKDGLAEIAHEELAQAFAEASDNDSSKPVTAWKNNWLTKDSDNRFVFGDINQQLRIIELAKIFKKYQQELEENQLYDFDDMILRTINALKTKDDLRFTLQEKYQFILLDEFQDTNKAQFELVEQLADNPVSEGKPNIFAVGDDDQAIYAFQGAKVSNMLAFKNAYNDVRVINLTENYRSHSDIIHVAHNIASQIESRLHTNLEGIDKTLIASSKDLPKESIIERHEFNGLANENAWVANKIKTLIDGGVSANEIAVLAPQHKYLESVVPFLVKNEVPLSYEKREDILQTTLIKNLRSMAELVMAAQSEDQVKMNQLFPQILSYEFYGIPVQEIWKINWTFRTSVDDRSWVEIALDSELLAPHVLFYLKLGLKSHTEPLEYILDYLNGSASIDLDEEYKYSSPLKDFYFSGDKKLDLKYYESIANLSTIREHLRSAQSNQDKLLQLADFLEFITAYETAEQPLINTHPIAQSNNSVQLMTTYKAKGLEFEYVFLLSVHDDVWGKKARGNTNKLSLPANLQHVRYQGSTEDELKRILFVAITRAKHGLFLTSHAMKDNGKPTEAVKYLLEFDDGNVRNTTVLPESKQLVNETNFDSSETMLNVQTLWESRHLILTTELKSLLKPRLDKYQMSPTHLNSFIDMEYGGPGSFLLQTLLRFPQAPGIDGEFGNAIHSTLDWYQNRINDSKTVGVDIVLAEYDKQLSKRYIPDEQKDDYRNRGHNALNSYLKIRSEMFSLNAKSEVDFRLEGVLIGDAHLSGKIDRLEIDNENKTVKIVDFKTGKPHTKWEKSVKLLKYKQQLYFYKLLIEGSHTWSNYKVTGARLEFVEPDIDGNITDPLIVDFDKDEQIEIIELIKSVWKIILSLDLPEISEYTNDYKGTEAFIQSLL